jgi:thiol-disulfide isomerase/thioredoxin
MNNNCINVNNLNDLVNILNIHRIVVMDIYADWCSPCKKYAPTFESIAKEFKGIQKIIFIKLDIENTEFENYTSDISSIPTFLIYRNNKRIAKIVGANDKTSNEIKEIIYKYI